MPAKKTDWKRERRQMQAWLENLPDNNFDPGTEILPRGNRSSEGTADHAPQSREEMMAMMQQGQLARAEPYISKTMAQRLRGLFGGGEDERSKRPRSARQAGATGR